MRPHILAYRILWLTAITVFAASCGKPERTYFKGGNAYFPLLEGRTMRYEEQSNGETRSYTMVMRYAGGHVSKVYLLKFKGADFGDCSFLGQDSVVMFSTSDPFITMEPRNSLPEYRQIWLDTSVKPGAKWMDEDTGTQTTYAGRELVNVPAGSFENCYKTDTDAVPELFDTLAARRDRGQLSLDDYQREQENAHQHIVRWFAPGVGLVKEQIGSSITRVLIKVENEGTGVDDTTRQEKIEYEG